MTDVTTDPLARALAEAMRAEVSDVLPPVTLLDGLSARAALRRRRRWTAAGALATATAVVAATVVTGADRDPAVPAAPAGMRPRAEATVLPPGFRLASAKGQPVALGPGHTGWTERVIYASTDKWITVVTTSGVPGAPVTVSDFRGSSTDAAWVRTGARRVVRVPGQLPHHLPRFAWTEAPGVDVIVSGEFAIAPGLSEKDLRTVVAGVRLTSVSPAPTPSPTLAQLVNYGKGVLLPNTYGRGSRTLGPITVPGRFEVVVACDGGRLRIRIGSVRENTVSCDDPGVVMTDFVDAPGGAVSVDVELVADRNTQWVISVLDSGVEP